MVTDTLALSQMLNLNHYPFRTYSFQINMLHEQDLKILSRECVYTCVCACMRECIHACVGVFVLKYMVMI